MSGNSPGEPDQDPRSNPHSLPPAMPPPSAAVDAIIRWHAQIRLKNPSQPLGEIVRGNAFELQSLVELVCVDLIGMRRRNQNVKVETYLKQFPQLASADENLLDLIDAEICVRNEVGDQLTLDEYATRFPKLSTTIKQLMFLDAPASPLQPASPQPASPQPAPRQQADSDQQSNHPAADAQPIRPPTKEPLSDERADLLPDRLPDRLPDGFDAAQATVEIDAASGIDHAQLIFNHDNDSIEFSLHREMTVNQHALNSLPQEPDGQGHDDSIDVVIPIQPPDWMTGARCIATSVLEFGRCWLVKGRDNERGDTVAMKVMPVPKTIGRKTRTRMLDMCENSSSVTHDAWVAPRIAAINNGHLAVVRPWVFGRSLERHSNALSDLKHLPRVAFALSAAHRIGATHGAVIGQNLIVDHEGNVRLIDATSGANGWIETWRCWSNELDQSLPARIQIDSVCLAQLMATKCVAPEPESRIHWIEQLTRGVTFNQPDACAILGENLQTLLDEGPTKKSWWKRG